MLESGVFRRRSFLKDIVTAAVGTSWLTESLTGAIDRQPGPSKPISVLENRPTILMGHAATLRGNPRARPLQDGTKHFHVSNWKGANDSFTWTVMARKAAECMVTALIKGGNASVELRTGSQKVLAAVNTDWDRIGLGIINLDEGANELTLRADPPGPGLELFALELTAPTLQRRLREQATALRSDTTWMRKAKYGLQFHWTSRSQPLHGRAKPYAQAVQDFPVRAFANMAHETGAGYVTFTTSHADYYFPAPIKAIDHILPGRTTGRDLVGELISALARHGLRLMLYYNLGHDDWRDPNGWWARSGGSSPEGPARLFENWCVINREIGERYGRGLAGWFFDGACVFCPLSPDFRWLTMSAKAGNPDRVVGYNAWIWPRCTDFQDYCCGEGYQFLKTRKDLPADGTGIFTGGPQRGLQAHANFILERDWCHDQPETPISPPAIVKDIFVRDIADAISCGIVPSVNLEIYQEGMAAEASLEYMKAVRALVKP